MELEVVKQGATSFTIAPAEDSLINHYFMVDPTITGFRLPGAKQPVYIVDKEMDFEELPPSTNELQSLLKMLNSINPKTPGLEIY